MHNAVAATLVRLVVKDERDDPRLVVAKDRQARAILEQYDDVRALIATGIDVGVYREAVR